MRTRGLKARVILDTLRGAEAPLFHVATDGRVFFSKLPVVSWFCLCGKFKSQSPQHQAKS